MKRKLPRITAANRWRAAAVGYVVFCLLYTLTGNLHLRAPVPLAPSPLDVGVPFLAWTVWIYHSQFVFLALTIAVLKREINLSRTLYAMGLASLLAFLIFLIFPTTIPRSVTLDEGVTAQAFAALYAMDAATNCLPSLHVALASLAAAGVMAESRRLGALACLWALLITLSTMTTKQHYAVDVVAGLALALICRALLPATVVEQADAAAPRRV